MKVLIVCDHYPLSPRVLKMKDSIINLYPLSKVIVYCWNRNNLKIDEDDVYSFNQNIGYNNKKTIIVGLIEFRKNLNDFIKDINPSHLHVIDFTMLISLKRLDKNINVIYEIYDIKFLKNKLLDKLRERIEIHRIKKIVNSIIYASPYFDLYYKSLLKNTEVGKIVVNNKPSNDVIKSESNYMDNYHNQLVNEFIVGFIGNARHYEILSNLINAVNQINGCKILIAGDGIALKKLRNEIEADIFEKNVITTGRYKSDDLSTIYSYCDVIWAAYPNDNRNVKYAISNKYFESLVFNKRIIVSENTHLGELVNSQNNGNSVNPYSVDEIVLLIVKVMNGVVDETKSLDLQGKLYWEDECNLLSEVY